MGSPGDEVDPIFAFLKKYIPKYWKLFCLAVACLTVEAICDLLQPTIMARIIDHGVATRRLDSVLRLGGLMLTVTALGAAAAVGRNILSSRVSQRFGTELRSDLFRQIQSLSLENLNRFETGSLVTRLTNDVTQVQNLVNGLMRIFVKAPLVCVGSIAMATLLNPHLALIFIVVVPVIGSLMFLNVRIGYPFFRKVQRMIDGLNSVIREYLSGVRVVKAFNRFEYETERFDRANRELAGVTTAATRVMAFFTPGITLTVNLGIIAVLWLGGLRVSGGQMPVGQVMAFVNYLIQILGSLMTISFVFNMLVRARASGERIGAVMAERNTMAVPERPLRPTEGGGRVEFDRVAFAYHRDGGEPVLREISFGAAPGETVGIIGSTGSGKSSLVGLIPRFYDVTAGAVRVDGVDVREMAPEQLRERIAMVPQQNVLFSGTILENIRWGKPDASAAEVEAAARAAQAHEFIAAMPEGYQTVLGQGGINLSGGQKQRIAIARALVKRPSLLILDDSTSAVDMATEARIRAAMKQYVRGMTCFLISQRIVSVMSADRIIVLDNGVVAGMGSHEQLLESCPVYQDIYRSQLGKEAV
ncbi:ABC transporter ATP-binding protein [Hydrogenispora ethanolica]|nr:ABC transporter ATP-binding protein [Hydrogenispora ethanolica]